jgi:hypothetical protein
LNDDEMMDERIDNMLAACRAYDGGTPDKTLIQVSSEFMSAAKNVSVLARASECLSDLPPHGAAWLALAFGSAVESGAGAHHAGQAVVDLFIEWLDRLPDPATLEGCEEKSLATTPEQATILAAMPRLCQSVVSHLAAMPLHRRELSQDEALLERLQALAACSFGIEWVREALIRTSGDMIVLHPPSMQGFKLRYDNVSLCFHLFSLIQGAIGNRLPGGRDPDAGVVEVAREQVHARVGDVAWWHYGSHLSRTADLAASIWGEQAVSSIPSIRGIKVILLWPPILGSRSWDSGFFGPPLHALPANVSIESPLSPDECLAWFAELGIEPASAQASVASDGTTRPWWKLW